MNVIENEAFSSGGAPNPKDPIIIHLRIKSSNASMFTNLSAIFESHSRIMLDKNYSYEYFGKNLGDVPLMDFMGKIILIVDKINTDFSQNVKLMEYVNMTSSSVFMRALPFNDIINSPDLQELQTFNKKNMTLAMPDNGNNPPNPNGISIRAAGCQFIAQRYQYVDRFLEENTFFFDTYGYAFILKPESLRFVPVTVAAPVPQNPDLNYAPKTVSADYYNFTI